MHRSQFAGLIIDCNTGDLDEAAAFWSLALGYPAKNLAEVEDNLYVGLDTPDSVPYFEVQSVEHASRVHLDIESDDIEAEATRLETLGARRIGRVRSWIVMEAPTGQRFCVVTPVSRNFAETANRWDTD